MTWYYTQQIQPYPEEYQELCTPTRQKTLQHFGGGFKMIKKTIYDVYMSINGGIETNVFHI